MRIGSLFVGQTQRSYFFSVDIPVATSRKAMTVTFPIFMRWNSFISREVPRVGEFQASLRFFRSWPRGGTVTCDQLERVRHNGNRTPARNFMAASAPNCTPSREKRKVYRAKNRVGLLL